MEAAQQSRTDWVRIHPLVVRITHWINVLAILIMVTSGWRIYNASPFFPFRIPSELTLGGWLAGALQWHFAAMWLLVLNGIVYVAYGIVSGHFKRKLLPLTPRAILHDVLEALLDNNHALRLAGLDQLRQPRVINVAGKIAGLYARLPVDGHEQHQGQQKVAQPIAPELAGGFRFNH